MSLGMYEMLFGPLWSIFIPSLASLTCSEKVDPLPGVLRTVIFPSICSASSLLMYRPRPNPVAREFSLIL